MSYTAATAADSSSPAAQMGGTGTQDSTNCTHCGLPVPGTLVHGHRELQFCCSGCEAVWTMLHECGLEDYYRLRNQFEQSASGPARVSGGSFDYLDDSELQRQFGQGETRGGLRIRFYLDGVHCIACAWLIEKVLVEREGASFAALDLGRSILEVCFDPTRIRLSRLATVLDRLGYTPHLLGTDEAGEQAGKEGRTILARMGIAAACAMNIMLLAISTYAGEHSGMDSGTASLFRWISLGLAIPALTYAAWPFYRGAWNGLRNKMLHMDLPISLGIVAAFVLSLVATIQERSEVYYDSASMLVFLLLAGRYVLQRATQKAFSAGDRLLHLEAKSARLRIADSERIVNLTDVRVGDRLRVFPGETIPVDGILEGDGGWLLESHLTGESTPVRKESGDTVYSGSGVLTSPVTLVATAVGGATRLRRLAELVRSSATRRAPVVALMDRVAGYFVGAVLLLALATAAIWYFLDPEKALWHAAAMLVVTCPCALAIGTPVALAVAMGRAAKKGIFIKGADGVERLAAVNHAILDKTGTMTEGKLSLVDAVFLHTITEPEQAVMLRDLGELEKQSGHVYATAFEQPPRSTTVISDVRSFAGAGVTGTVNHRDYAAGTASFLLDRGIVIDESLRAHANHIAHQGFSTFFLACDGRAVAHIAVGDKIRKTAAGAVRQLHDMGITTELLSGDSSESVASVANELKIAKFSGRAQPEDKLHRVGTLESEGYKTVMVGDGVNDAAALARATVGISPAGAAEVARSAADIFVSSSGPEAVADSIQLSRRAMRVVRINIAVGVAYNLVGASLAVSGYISPLLAAILMPVSSMTALFIATRG